MPETPNSSQPTNKKMTSEIIKIAASTKIKTTRYDNGGVKSKTPYVNGKKHGTEIRWYYTAQKSREVMWRDGKKHGSETDWAHDGTKWCEVTWVNGERHGAQTMWLERDRKESETIFRNEKIHGIATSWGEDGTTVEYYYVQGNLFSHLTVGREGDVIVTDFKLHPTLPDNKSKRNSQNKKIISCRK